jgi:hypothetical protein
MGFGINIIDFFKIRSNNMSKITLCSLSMFILFVNILTGCASIVSGTTQDISVITIPTGGANCMLTNSKGSWYINKTPGSVYIHRAYGKMHITCHKSGCPIVSRNVESKTKGIVAGNVAFGLFGGVIGGGVDVADGAAYTYPQQIIIPMKCI